MVSLTGSLTDSVRFYLEWSKLDNLEAEPLFLKTKRSNYYDRLISYPSNEIIPNNLVDRTESEARIRDLKAPPDKFYIAALVAFFSGVVSVMAQNFFLIANDYWMYKFRDPTQDNYDLNNKNFFQTNFVSMICAVKTFPSLIAVILTAKYGYKMKIKNRLLISLGIIFALFLIFAILADVNTDTWQTLFFGLTLSMFGIFAFIHPYYSISVAALLSKLPIFYMELNMSGVVISGLFGTILQIISLAVGKSSTESALIYFYSGMAIVVLTILLTFVIKYSPYMHYYTKDSQEEDNNNYSMREYLEVSKKIWFILLIWVVISATTNLGHPNITNLVVSEGYTGIGKNVWYDKYFVVIATYLLYDVFQILGRFASRFVIKRKYAIYYIIFSVFRSFILTPLLWFCNIQPRSHLPVLFPHDYQYIILLAINSFTNSVFMGILFISIPPIAQEKTEQGFIVMSALSTIASTITSPLSPIYVNLL